VDTVYISVSKQSVLSLATVSTQLAVTLRRAELTRKYVDSYHIAVNITHGTVIAFRIGTFRVIDKKLMAFSLFLSENYEGILCL